MSRHCTAFRNRLGRRKRPLDKLGRRKRPLDIAAGVAIALCGAGWVREARAYEDQASLDLALGATVTAQAETLRQAGPEVSAGGAIGLSDLFVLRGQVGYLPLFDAGAVQHVGRARVEAAYLLDVLKVVPFFGLGASLWLYRAGDPFEVRPGGHVLLGVDYLWSRAWSVGVDVRVGLVIEPGHAASTTEAQVRLSRMFELF